MCVRERERERERERPPLLNRALNSVLKYINRELNRASKDVKENFLIYIKGVSKTCIKIYKHN